MTVDVTALAISVTSTGIKEASQQLGGLSTSAGNAATRIEKLTEALRKLQTSSTTITQTMGSTSALTAALTALNNSLVILNQRTQQADTTQRRHNESMREAHGLARGLTGSLGALWLSYGAFAGMATGLAIGASLKGIVTVGKDVEHTLEGIRVRGNETTASVDKMRKAIFSLGTGVYGPQQVASAFETLVLAGLNAEQAMVSVNAAMNLAVVGGTTIEKAAQTLVSVGTAVGYTAEGFDRVGDVIAKTAALSMSSVATLSEAFKSASSVNKLYGVTLEDIGTGLGILSNLGIQGSAAGTAMKNFYKELAAGSDKVTSTLKSMKLTQESFKDSKGMFLPFVEVIGILDTGLKRLTESQQKVAIANLTNERGLRLGVQALGEYNTKVGESSNALAEFQKNVTNSQGFAAIGAVAMSLTAKSQIESMLNSLKTTFAETFTEMQPEIIAFTGRMKEIFKSEEFKKGIMFLAQSFANLAVAIADNLPLITKLIIAFTALKVIIAGGAMWSAVATGLASIGAAFTAASAGALTFTAALGPIALLLAGVTAAVILYNNAQADANKNTAMAADYSNGYLSGLEEEANRLAKVNAQLATKKTLSEANAEITRAEARDKMNQLNKKAIDEAQNNLDNGTKWTGYTKITQEKALADAKAKYSEDNRIAMEQENRIKEYSLRIDEKVKANAKENRAGSGGEGELSTKPDRAKLNDAYGAAQLAQMATIKSARREMQAFEDQQNTLFKMGEIGKLQFLENVQEKQIELFIKAQDARREQLAIAQKRGSQADVTRISGDMDQAQEDLDNKNVQSRLNKEATVQKAVEEYTRLRITQLEEEHSYAKAAQLRWSSDHSAAYEQAKADAAAYGDIYPILNDRVEQFAATQKAAVKNGLNRDAVNDFNIAAEATRNAMKGIQTASEGNGLVAMFDAAKAASERYAADLPALREKMGKLTDPKDINEAQAELTRLAETQRKLWEGVGESISNSLQSAFGKAGEAAGNLLMVGIKASNTEKQLASDKAKALADTEDAYQRFGFSRADTDKALNKVSLDYSKKEGGARIKAYGDAAGAAKGFFKEGTTGYKVMEGAEKAFRAIELAGMAKSLATTIADSAVKAAAYIPEFLMAWGKLGPWGLAAGAVAIAAILGSSGGGSAPTSAADRQENAGKGSVLGDKDAKSESIANSLEILEKNSGLGLVHSSSMVKSLNAIVNGIGQLGSLVAQEKIGVAAIKNKEAGGFWGKLGNSIFGGNTTVQDNGVAVSKTALGDLSSLTAQNYTDTKKSGGWFSSDKYNTITSDVGAEATGQIAKIIQNMSAGITTAVGDLGLGGNEFTEKLKTFVVDIGSISFKGLSGEEIQKQFESIFSKLGDDMAKFAVEGLDQKIGEGYFETLVRVANELIQVKDVFAVMGQEFNMTGLQAVKVSQSLIDAAGGLEKLTDGSKFFVDNFLTEAEKMGPITDSVTKRLAELGMSELTTIELYKDKVRALDLTNAADQELFGNLIELAPVFKDAADYADRLATGTVNLTKAQQAAKDIADKQRELDIRLMEVQGNSLGAIAARRSDELAALAKLSPALANTQAALYDLETAANSFSTKRGLELRLMEASGDTIGALARKREDEIKALAKTNPELVDFLKSIHTAEDATKAGTIANENNTKALADAKNVLEEAYQRESTAMQGVVDKFKSFSDSLKKFKASLLSGDLSTLSPEQKYLQSKDKFITTSAMAGQGDIKAIEALQDVSQEFLDASRGYNASTEAYARDFDLVQKALDKGVEAADSQANAAASQLAVLKSQYDATLGVKNAVISFKDAFDAYAAIKAASGTTAIEGAYKDALGRAPEKAGMDYWKGQIDKGIINTSTAVDLITNSPEAKINAIYRKILNRDSDTSGMAFWMKALNAGQITLEGIETNIAQSAEARGVQVDGSHFNGLDEVPFDNYIGRLHKGERVQTAKAANASDENSAELVRLTKELLERISKMETHAEASNMQRGAIAEMTAEQLESVKVGLDTVARKVSKLETK